MLEDLQAVADSLSLQLQRSVAIDDVQLNLLVHTPHRMENVDAYRVHSIMQKSVDPAMAEWALSSGVETATSPVRVEGDAEAGVITRVGVPIRCQQILLGYLWLLDPDATLSDPDLAQAVQAAEDAGEIMFRQQLLGDIERGRGRELLRDLLSPDEAVREYAAQQLVETSRMPEGAKCTVLVLRIEPTGGAGHEVLIDLALQRGARRLAPNSSLSVTRGGSTGVLVLAARSAPTPTRIREAAADMHAALVAQLESGERAYVGIGPTVPTFTATHDSLRYAQDAIRVAMQVPGYGPISTWDSLGIYKLLVLLPIDQIRDGAIPPGLLELRDSGDSRTLVETLEVYLDEASNVPTTVKRLHVHRSTLYYRIERIEKLTGMSLRDGGDRLALHIGIKFARLTGALDE